MDFTQKRVLITGSTDGIGRAAADMFHAAGARVAVNGPTPDAVARAMDEMGGARVVAAAGDVATVAGCRSVVALAVAGLGGLDCLVNNAGIWPRVTMMDTTEEDWDAVMSVNLRSAMFCTTAALASLRAARGSVVMVAAAAGLMAGPSDSFAYSISKAGLVGMTRTLALELAPDGVRVNCVCPGFIDTPSTRARNTATGGQVDRFVGAATPLGRLGTARECASAILYLASIDAAYCTGTTLVADGGSAAHASWATKEDGRTAR